MRWCHFFIAAQADVGRCCPDACATQTHTMLAGLPPSARTPTAPAAAPAGVAGPKRAARAPAGDAPPPKKTKASGGVATPAPAATSTHAAPGDAAPGAAAAAAGKKSGRKAPVTGAKRALVARRLALVILRQQTHGTVDASGAPVEMRMSRGAAKVIGAVADHIFLAIRDELTRSRAGPRVTKMTNLPDIAAVVAALIHESDAQAAAIAAIDKACKIGHEQWLRRSAETRKRILMRLTAPGAPAADAKAVAGAKAALATAIADAAAAGIAITEAELEAEIVALTAASAQKKTVADEKKRGKDGKDGKGGAARDGPGGARAQPKMRLTQVLTGGLTLPTSRVAGALGKTGRLKMKTAARLAIVALLDFLVTTLIRYAAGHALGAGMHTLHARHVAAAFDDPHMAAIYPAVFIVDPERRIPLPPSVPPFPAKASVAAKKKKKAAAAAAAKAKAAAATPAPAPTPAPAAKKPATPAPKGAKKAGDAAPRPATPPAAAPKTPKAPKAAPTPAPAPAAPTPAPAAAKTPKPPKAAAAGPATPAPAAPATPAKPRKPKAAAATPAAA